MQLKRSCIDQQNLSTFVRAFAVLALSLYSALSFSQQTIRVAALNAEWLWTPYDNRVDGGRYNEGDPSPSEYESELDYYASLIRQYGVDVIALSEIENEQVALEFAEKAGSDWRIAFRQGRDTATGQDVAILSRIGTIEEVTDFGFPSGKVRGMKPKRLSKVVGASITLGDKRLRFITSHFLSKRNDSASKSAKRLMQAKAIVNAVKNDAPHDAWVVLGDFNDFKGSPVMDELEGGAALSNAQTICESRPDKTRWLVDHVLFKNMTCNSLQVIPMNNYSDHPMLIAELVF